MENIRLYFVLVGEPFNLFPRFWIIGHDVLWDRSILEFSESITVLKPGIIPRMALNYFVASVEISADFSQQLNNNQKKIVVIICTLRS